MSHPIFKLHPPYTGKAPGQSVRSCRKRRYRKADLEEVEMATQVMPKGDSVKPQAAISLESDWTKPQAMAIPKEGYFTPEKGRYGVIFPRTPACYGFTIIAKIIPGREPTF